MSDWVRVPYNQARYGRSNGEPCIINVCSNVWAIIDDGVAAWIQQQQQAGLSTEQIRERLARYDVWDRYDGDGDGNFNEPDGYIDHFQIVHAGGDQATMDPQYGEDAIWSHRWYSHIDQVGQTGPPVNLFGGTQIGDTGVWVGDYTIQPENGGLGVFAHEFGHDLGLPDLYDGSGLGEGATGFWTPMSNGNYLGPGREAIGTRPGDFSAWEKLQLGWLDYDVAYAGQRSTHTLGPAEYNQIDLSTASGSVFSDGAEDGDNGWQLTGFRATTGVEHSYHPGYYLAEYRTYLSFDSGLRTGPYNFGFVTTRPRFVEHFPYQDGLLVSYWDTSQADNNVGLHPCEGLVLVVDAHPEIMTAPSGGLWRSRVELYDATFGRQATDRFSLHDDSVEQRVPARPAEPTFDDRREQCMPEFPDSGVSLPRTGTTITVRSQSRTTMEVMVGTGTGRRADGSASRSGSRFAAVEPSAPYRVSFVNNPIHRD